MFFGNIDGPVRFSRFSLMIWTINRKELSISVLILPLAKGIGPSAGGFEVVDITSASIVDGVSTTGLADGILHAIIDEASVSGGKYFSKGIEA